MSLPSHIASICPYHGYTLTIDGEKISDWYFSHFTGPHNFITLTLCDDKNQPYAKHSLPIEFALNGGKVRTSGHVYHLKQTHL